MPSLLIAFACSVNYVALLCRNFRLQVYHEQLEHATDLLQLQNPVIGSRCSYSNCRVDEVSVPISSIVVPFWGSYLDFYKVTPNKEPLWSLWVRAPGRV